MKAAVSLLILLIGLSGCRSSTSCDLVIGSGWVQGRIAFWQYDPLHGLYTDLDSSLFDVGVSLSRETYADGTNALRPQARVAFEEAPNRSRSGTASAAANAVVNGLELGWQDCNSHNGADTYFRQDSSLYGSDDSVTYRYTGFNGDSFAGTADIARPFGRFDIDHSTTVGDTISISKGFTLHYPNAVPGDSILVAINALDTPAIPYYVVPDNGTITFKPNFIPYNSRIAEVGLFVVDFIRVHLRKQTSPGGKRIAVYSTFSADCDFDAKP
jgi:hypothetical protein